jgi:glycosyltransferase involved in cell wall biosynthesis
MEFPLCSAICPTRNRRRFIPQLVQGFLAQSYPVKELVIVNGGEPIDDLLPVGYGRLIMCIDYKSDQPNAAARIAEALNIGIRAARGEYCFRFDDDDFQATDRIEKQMALFNLTGKSVVAGSSGLFLEEGSREVFEYTGDPWQCSGFSHAFKREYALAHPYPEHATEQTGEDLMFIREAYERGELCTISGADWLVARDHEGGTSGGRFSTPARREFLLSSDNWRPVPAERIHAILNR